MEPDAVRRRRRLAWAVALLLLAALYGPSLLAHARRAAHPLVFNNDARQQVFPFYRYADPALFRDDPIADYYLSCFFPVGYRTLFASAARHWDPGGLSDALPYALLAATALALGAAAARLAGVAAAWGTMALCLGSGLALAKLGGTLPRAFAFPLLAGALAALAHGRALALVLLTWLGAALYPVAGAVTGLSLAGLLALPARDRGEARAWSARTRALVLAGTAALAALLVLPSARPPERCGALIRPADAVEFPEAGRGGRYRLAGREAGPGPAERLLGSLRSAGPAWCPRARAWLPEPASPRSRPGPTAMLLAGGLLAFALGFGRLALHDAGARRVLLLGGAALVGHAAARLASPYLYLPDRYLSFPLPLLAWLVLPASAAGWAALLRGGARGGRVEAAAVAAGSLLFVLGFGGRVDPRGGVQIDLRGSSELFAALAATPADARIAGWPAGPMDSVPLATRRSAFLTYETHQAFHRRHTRLLRARMLALVDAYFATSPEPLRRLRDEHGVTHLVVDRRHFSGAPPGTFEPFREPVRRAAERARREGPEVLRQLDAEGGFRRGPIAVLELARVE